MRRSIPILTAKSNIDTSTSVGTHVPSETWQWLGGKFENYSGLDPKQIYLQNCNQERNVCYQELHDLHCQNTPSDYTQITPGSYMVHFMSDQCKKCLIPSDLNETWFVHSVYRDSKVSWVLGPLPSIDTQLEPSTMSFFLVNFRFTHRYLISCNLATIIFTSHKIHQSYLIKCSFVWYIYIVHCMNLGSKVMLVHFDLWCLKNRYLISINLGLNIVWIFLFDWCEFDLGLPWI